MVGERKRRLFLASPYGFSATHADSGRWVFRCILTSLGADVRDPRAIAGDADRQGSVCAIKGNISAGGERIYHVPGGDYYERTGIGTDRGERWFCSEAEAREAGWRKSRR